MSYHKSLKMKEELNIGLLCSRSSEGPLAPDRLIRIKVATISQAGKSE